MAPTWAGPGLFKLRFDFAPDTFLSIDCENSLRFEILMSFHGKPCAEICRRHAFLI